LLIVARNNLKEGEGEGERESLLRNLFKRSEATTACGVINPLACPSPTVTFLIYEEFSLNEAKYIFDQTI